MRNRAAWVSGALGGAALAVALARRRRASTTVRPADAAESPADDLRRKLAESRSLVAERDDFESGETPVDRVEPVGGDPDARRRRVHEHGRAAVERMRDVSPGE